MIQERMGYAEGRGGACGRGTCVSLDGLPQRKPCTGAVRALVRSLAKLHGGYQVIQQILAHHSWPALPAGDCDGGLLPASTGEGLHLRLEHT